MWYRLKFSLIFTFFTILFLFYPGDSYFYNLFAWNKEVLNRKTVSEEIKLAPIPYSKNAYPLQISAEGVYIVDLPTFTPIFEKNAHEKLFPASTTKIITALVGRDVYKPDDILTVKNISTIPPEVMGLVEGEQISFENLLYGMLIQSGNDAAYAVANAYGYDKFIAKMNEKAQKLHMKDTTFKNPAGLDDEEQLTTPYDLALASRALLEDPLLKKIVSIKEITISDADFKYFHQLTNVNKLLGETPGFGGLKTGYTEGAGENLVSFYKKNGHEFLIVILKSDDRFADTKSVGKWIDDNIDFMDIQ
jgi:D-alanyl-D-alanine carboxypeptidase (penicillin-binding protein 5/6)